MSIAGRMGWTKKDMVLIAINTVFIIILLTVYCQSTGLEARKNRAIALAEGDAKKAIEYIKKDLGSAPRSSIELVLLQENPPTIKIAMQVYFKNENKLVPVTYFKVNKTFSRVVRHKKKVISRILNNLYIQSDPSTGDFMLQSNCEIPVEGLKDNIWSKATDRVRPLESVPEDVILETEEGIEMDAASAEEEEENSDSTIDLYIKYSEYDILSLEKEKSDIRVELDRNKMRLNTINSNLENDVPGLKHAETFNIILPELNDPEILEDINEDPSIEEGYKKHIEEKATLLNYRIDMKKEMKVLEEIIKKKKKTQFKKKKKLEEESE